MKLDYDQGIFTLRCLFEERDIPKKSGFIWSPERKLWFTAKPSVAFPFAKEFGSESALNFFAAKTLNRLPLPESCALLPQFYAHQHRALEFCLTRDRSYLALDPGLGKTAVAAYAAERFAWGRHKQFICYYVCPPFLVRNVLSEFAYWAPLIIASPINGRGFHLADVKIIPDTMLEKVSPPPVKADSLLIVDEAHRFKTPSAKRTKALLGKKGLSQYFKRRIYMSGTPMPNRPIELYSILSREVPDVIGFRNQTEYGEYFCNGQLGVNGWDFSGVSNSLELFSGMKKDFMLRITKEEALDLPPKTEQVFALSADMTYTLCALDLKIAKDYRACLDQVKTKVAEENSPLATYRRLLGEEKARAAIPYVKSILDDSNEKVIVVAYHKAAIAALVSSLSEYDPLLITGDDPPVKCRQNIVDEFQKNPKRKILIGNYLTMGVGFTLTKATRLLFIEFSWSPGENEQTADRIHRIGQTEKVLIQYMVFKGSVDEAQVRALLKKRKTIKSIETV